MNGGYFCISYFGHLCGGQTSSTPIRRVHLLSPVGRAITQSSWSIHRSKEHCYRPSHLGQCCWLNSSPLGHRWPMAVYSNIIWLQDNCDPFGQPQPCFANSHCPEGVDLPGCLSIQSYWDTRSGPLLKQRVLISFTAWADPLTSVLFERWVSGESRSWGDLGQGFFLATHSSLRKY